MKNTLIQFIRPAMALCLLVLGAVVYSCQEQSNKEVTQGDSNASELTIHAAVFMGDLEALKAHIAGGTDLNTKDDFGSTSLAIAATFGKTEMAKMLIEAGAGINVKAADGSTPLHTAAFFCRTEIVKMLLEKGCDTEVRNAFGSTALESVTSSFKQIKPFYLQLEKQLGPLGLKLDYERLENTRPEIAQMISDYQQKQ